MKHPNHQHGTCQICGESNPRREQFPRWSSEGFSYRPDLTVYRSCYFECMVASESGELTALENEVVSMVLETAHVRQITDATPGPPAFLI